MQLKAPSRSVLVSIALLCEASGMLAYFTYIPVLSFYAFWLLALGFLILVMALLLKHA